MKRLVHHLSISCLILALPGFAQQTSHPWKEVTFPRASYKENADRWAKHYRTIQLSMEEAGNWLAQAPSESLVPIRKSDFIFYLPMPDGSFSAFRLVESPVMEKGLSDAYPQIKTYAGMGIDDPAASLRCSLTPLGFRAMMITAGQTVFIDPPDRTVTDEYISYYKEDALAQDFNQECLLTENDEKCDVKSPLTLENPKISGTLRTYRLALACTGEYTTYHGGTRLGALSAMVATMNRVNGVYERELGIHMNIIANDTLLIFLNPSTDPFTNDQGDAMLDQNQTVCTNIIGSANYDIGHVFSTGGGGIANRGCICQSTKKAKGVTGQSTPIGDAFDIDYVAHEMGHQFGANHTFNSTSGSCGGGNRVSSAAYEPGSASTIMGYAGICMGQDLQSHSDDYFHSKSIEEIVSYTQAGMGNTCAAITNNSNNPPVLTLPGNYSIPISTPFKLTASATDPDGDVVTYCWEEYDLGPAGNWNAPSGNAPIFRSFDPVTTGTRLFPKLLNILNNSTTIGEIKPSYSRTLNFRCTVRDNVLDGASVLYNPTPVQVFVVPTPGPFAVLTPNTTGISWPAFSTQTVTWSVNGTDQPPINTPTVNIYLSVDGGINFPFTLGLGVPNTGSYSFFVPDAATPGGRIMVEGAGNIFFDINDKNFNITSSAGIDRNFFSESMNLYPNPTDGKTTLVMINKENGPLDILLTGLTGKVIASWFVSKNKETFQYDFDLETLPAGVYFLTVKSTQSMGVKRLFVR